MVWDSQFMNITTAHVTAAAIISRVWHFHGVGPSVYEHHDSSCTSGSHHLEIMASPWCVTQSMNVMTAHVPAAVIISRFWYLHVVGLTVNEHHGRLCNSGGYHVEDQSFPWSGTISL
ncbi:hypothetical protein DPMN_132204 [Dreissena polymorpha]|uniref:Uncharacterized protein n=1 Tax=Dreissena polymorpha TaxID=45954 RepID=A0A9D4JDJ9_DREPO|nr:hypothetical protein DPMN_132204 [Dreissena polymorpha]